MAVEEKGEGLLVVGVMAVTVPVEVVPVEARTAAVMVEEGECFVSGVRSCI